MSDAAEPGLDALLSLPEIGAWPAATALLRRRSGTGLACWDLAFSACAALGAPRARADLAAGAVRALFLAVHLVDDMLDDDPRGEFHRLGPGATANLAMALQAAALRLVAGGGFDLVATSAMQQSLARAALGTAYGQHLDVQPHAGAADYFRTVDAKTPPLFVCALEVGALAGGALPSEAARVAALGKKVGRIVQTSDDLADAFARPAGPDWQSPARNLAIGYAASADHPGRERFLTLLGRASEDEAALVEAQALLFRSGAVSACAYHIVQTYRSGMAELDALELPDPAPLAAVFQAHVRPVVELLRDAGVEAPERLIDASTLAAEARTIPPARGADEAGLDAM